MSCNPDNSHAGVESDDVVDRAARDRLSGLIRQFLSDQMTAFDFDDALYACPESADTTVNFVSHTVWSIYDDCVDHHVALAKPEWDYLQRLLLLLESDRQVTTTSASHWSWTQLVACASLLAFACCIWIFGWGLHLLIFSVPFGVVSIFLSCFRTRIRPTLPYAETLTPFATFTELSATYRSTATFSKNRYPEGLTQRRIRSRVAEFGVHLQMYAAWLTLSPIPLLFQMFPLTETRTSIRTA